MRPTRDIFQWGGEKKQEINHQKIGELKTEYDEKKINRGPSPDNWGGGAYPIRTLKEAAAFAIEGNIEKSRKGPHSKGKKAGESGHDSFLVALNLARTCSWQAQKRGSGTRRPERRLSFSEKPACMGLLHEQRMTK